jgi:hypothetical protein
MVNSQGVLFGPRFGLAWTPLGAGRNLAPRPVLSCNPSKSPGCRSLYAFINTSCFGPACVGGTGMDSSLRSMRGPGVDNWNLSLFKKHPLGHSEERYLQWRLETYTTWNHAQFGGAVVSNYEAGCSRQSYP